MRATSHPLVARRRIVEASKLSGFYPLTRVKSTRGSAYSLLRVDRTDRLSGTALQTGMNDRGRCTAHEWDRKRRARNATIWSCCAWSIAFSSSRPSRRYAQVAQARKTRPMQRFRAFSAAIQHQSTTWFPPQAEHIPPLAVHA